jgi:hypothetical protein
MKSWFLSGADPSNYECGISSHFTFGEKKTAYLQPIDGSQVSGRWACMMQMFKADTWRNKRMKFGGAVKSSGVDESAGLWMRVDGPKGEMLGFDNMSKRGITGDTEWTKYDVVLEVPEEGVYIAFGLLLRGKGIVWLANVTFEETEDAVTETPDSDYPDGPGNLDFSEEEEDK